MSSNASSSSSSSSTHWRELAHAGRVDPQRAVGRDEQLAARRRVAAAVVVADRRVSWCRRRRSALSSDDLPTPELPSRTAVRPRPDERADRVEPVPLATTDDRGHRGERARAARAAALDRRRDRSSTARARRDAAVAQQREVAIEPRRRRDRCSPTSSRSRRRRSRRAAAARSPRRRPCARAGCAAAGSRGSRAAAASVRPRRARRSQRSTMHPVADGRQLALVRRARGTRCPGSSTPRDATVAAGVIRAAMLRDDPHRRALRRDRPPPTRRPSRAPRASLTPTARARAARAGTRWRPFATLSSSAASSTPRSGSARISSSVSHAAPSDSSSAMRLRRRYRRPACR